MPMKQRRHWAVNFPKMWFKNTCYVSNLAVISIEIMYEASVNWGSIRMASGINDPYLVNQFLMPILSMSILRPCSSNLKEKLFAIESILLNANQTLLSQFLDRFVIIDKSRRLTGSKREELYEQRMCTLEFLTDWITGYLECMVLVMYRQNNEIDTCSNE